MYRDPSVGNLINIMIVKLVVVHNEQVSSPCVHVCDMSDVSAGVPGLAFRFGAPLKGHCLPCQFQVSREVSLENKWCYSHSYAASHLQMISLKRLIVGLLLFE